MPARNSRKYYEEDAMYHVYSRGRSRSDIFRDPADYNVFLGILKRYLSRKQTSNDFGLPYMNFFGRIELVSFCLMKNHIHLLFYQTDNKAIQQLLQRLFGSYVVYFNNKYGESGPLFESRYKASHIANESYFQHISRYIDMNPTDWSNYEHSSLAYLKQGYDPDWFRPERTQSLFNGLPDYMRFLHSYDDEKQKLKALKHAPEY